MSGTEEQMDIDIAINDIKQMRNGFISYVGDSAGNDSHFLAGMDGFEGQEQAGDTIDDLLDPNKFIERHFGAENPDIIFQEIITEVPDPPQPEP